MTLNITVVTPRRIYQCSDYRFTSIETGVFTDRGMHHKVQLCSVACWSATITFNGIGSIDGMNVSEWLAQQVSTIDFRDPFERLLELLMGAQHWLKPINPPRAHSFVIGAFVNYRPVYALVSNCEDLTGKAKPPSKDLYQLVEYPKSAKAFVSGRPRRLVTMDQRARLRDLALLHKTAAPEPVFNALAATNVSVAHSDPDSTVSLECYTAYVQRTGEAMGHPHGLEVPPEVMGSGMGYVGVDYLRERLGMNGGGVKGISIARVVQTEEDHLAQLRDKPNDPSVHSNYGAFLDNVKKDSEGAERAFRAALKLDPNLPIALSNLANVLARQGNTEQAAELYERALAKRPLFASACLNLAELKLKGDWLGARTLVEEGLNDHPSNPQLLLLRARISLVHARNAEEALSYYERARQCGASQEEVETGYASALHVANAPLNECIDAYRTAIAVSAPNGDRTLNLAQLLFARGDHDEATNHLRHASKLGLSEPAKIEYEFYRLAHTQDDIADIRRILNELIAKGVRLDWNVQPNIALVRRTAPEKADVLERVLTCLAEGTGSIDLLLEKWGAR